MSKDKDAHFDNREKTHLAAENNARKASWRRRAIDIRTEKATGKKAKTWGGEKDER